MPVTKGQAYTLVRAADVTQDLRTKMLGLLGMHRGLWEALEEDELLPVLRNQVSTQEMPALERRVHDLEIGMKLTRQASAMTSASYEQFYEDEDVQRVRANELAFSQRLPAIAERKPCPVFPGIDVNENKVMIPQFVQELEKLQRSGAARALYTVINTHRLRYLNNLAPDITIVTPKHPPTPFNVVCVFEMQRGKLDNQHRGKAVKYCLLMMEANIKRTHAICVVTNTVSLEVFEVRRTEQGYKTFCSNEMLLEGDGWHLFCNIILYSSPESLGWQVPRLVDDKKEEYEAVGFLGMGRGAEVYEVKHGSLDEHLACKLFRPNRERAFKAELQTLKAIKNAPQPHPALPRLVAHSSEDRLLLTQPVTKPLERLTDARLKELMGCLSYLHTVVKVVHRDVEPKHLGEVAGSGLGLLDLGSAATLDSGGPSTRSRRPVPPSDRQRYAGTLFFAADSVLEALASRQPPVAHVKEDMVAAVKSVYVLVHASVAQALQGAQKSVAEAVAQEDMQTATQTVKDFWDQELSQSTPAGQAWRELVRHAHDLPEPQYQATEYHIGVKRLVQDLGRMLRAAL